MHVSQIVGNKDNVAKLTTYLTQFHKKFAKIKAGRGVNVKKAMLLSGPPGIGKTTAASLVAQVG